MDNKIIFALFFACMISCSYAISAQCHANCGGSRADGTDCVSGQSGADKCYTCPGSEVLVYATTQATEGTCTSSSGSITVASICGDGKYGVFDTTLATPTFCGGAGASTKCVVCKSTGNHCITFLYKDNLISGNAIIAFNNANYFSTEPTRFCTGCATTHFPKVETTGDEAGTCQLWNNCASTQYVKSDGSFGICHTPVATNTVSGPIYSKKPCATFKAQTAYIATDTLALDTCLTCGTNNQLLVTSGSATEGQCVQTSAGTDTSVYCAANKYLSTQAVTGICTGASTCVVCTTSTTNCATFSYKADATSTGATIYSFSSEPSDRCKTCQTPASQFIKLAAQANIAGECVTLTSNVCSTTQALISKDGTSTVYFYCKAPTPVSPKEFCQTYAYHSGTPHLTDASAMDDCATCAAGEAWIVASTGGGSNTYGSCINNANINTHCGSSYYAKIVSSNKGYCQQVAAATIGSFQAQKCSTFRYTSSVLNYASDNDALVKCSGCFDSANHVIAGETNSAIAYGTCLAYTSNTAYCQTYGSYYYLKTGSGSNVAYCSLLSIGNSLPCLTFYYSSSQKTIVDDATALTQCASCDPRKLWVNPDASTTTYGKCVDNPKTPTPSCAANYWIQQRVGQNWQGYCQTGPAPGNQQQCDTFFYGEAFFFTASDTNIYNKCLTCANLLVKGIGEKNGKCYASTTNAAADCPQYTYLRKFTQNGVTFSFCQETPTPPDPFIKCTTYYYGANNWLDVTPENAYQYCNSCTGNGQILISSSGNQYGRCYIDTSKVSSICNANAREYLKFIDGTFTICQAPDWLDANQVGCTDYYYMGVLYITQPGTIKCTSCGNGELFVVNSDGDQYGRCFNSATTICSAGTFLQKVSNANKYKCVASTKCSSFNYKDGFNNNIYWYIDTYHAEADCNTCSNSAYAKIAGPNLLFKYCQTSIKCSAFAAGNYVSIEDAEKKCTGCNTGYYYEIATPGDAFGKCVASESCNSFFDASYLSTDSPNTKCISCKSGYWYKKNDNGNYGSCEKSTDCKTSSLAFTVSATQAGETFSNICTQCQLGFFSVTPAGASDSACKAYEASSNCLKSYPGETYADNTAANLKCIQCKDNYFVQKTVVANNYGECVLLTNKYTCQQFTGTGIGMNEVNFAQIAVCIKCPNDFYYIFNGKCTRCPGKCRTCLPNPTTNQRFNGDFCTSCFDGSADLVLYTNSLIGKCLACSGSCRSCGGIYVSTAYNTNDRRCDSCGAAKYFAIEPEYDAGICVDCLKMNQNCLRCSSFGMCTQCKDGYFENNEGNCVACKTDCSICRDADTCLVSQCVTGCANCTANTFEGCTQNAVGYFKDTAAYTLCYSGCQKCTASTYDGCTQWGLQPTGTDCLTNCKTCNGTAKTIAECTATVDGFYKTETAVVACILGCKTCTGGVYETCSDCFDGFYKNNDGKVCDKCHFNCATCSGPNMDQCTKCLPIDGYQTFVRLPAERGYQGYCDFCHNSCKTCGGRASSPLAGCTSCWSGKLLEIYFTGSDGANNGWCVEKCPSGTFQEGTNCKKCILGSPDPCPQAPVSSSSIYLTLTITLLITFILLL